MKLFLLPLLLCFSSCSPQSPYAGVANGADVRIGLVGGSSERGLVEVVTKAGVEISRLKPTPVIESRGAYSFEELRLLTSNGRISRFIPWSSIVSVTIERPAYHGSWFEEAWDWFKERLFWIG
jgi:hypothetical protein